LNDAARSPNSSSDRTGSRYSRSPSATLCVPLISSFTGRYTTTQMNRMLINDAMPNAANVK
jgi:hypothetical protein